MKIQTDHFIVDGSALQHLAGLFHFVKPPFHRIGLDTPSGQTEDLLVWIGDEDCQCSGLNSPFHTSCNEGSGLQQGKSGRK